MKKGLAFLTFALLAGQALHAQPVNTVTGKRLYEHHSADVGGAGGIDPTQSGYDFVNHAYVQSFDTNTYTSHTDGTDTTIDMVEHNGPYGNNGAFGFTSGMSSIWNNEIWGNGKTMWMKAPAGFNYAGLTDVATIASAFVPATATQSIAIAEENTIYLGRIRNTNMYVAMRTYNVTNKVNNNTYFDFDYKYGMFATGVNDVKAVSALSVYPNPATDKLTLKNKLGATLTAKVVSVTGQEVSSFSVAANEVKTINLSGMSYGLYMIVCTAKDGSSYTHRFVKQ